MAIARISVTVPRDLVAAADRRARELDRSRSWLVADALRRYLSGGPNAAPRSGRVVTEPVAAYTAVASEVAEARRRHRAAELALPAVERLRRAEELGRLARQAQRRPRRQQVIGFDSYEDFYQWKKARLVGA